HRVPHGHQADALTRVDADRLHGGPSRAMRAHDASVASVPGPALRAFGERFHGRLFSPADEGYDEARSIWNGAIDRRPGLVARCAHASGVGGRGGFAPG